MGVVMVVRFLFSCIFSFGAALGMIHGTSAVAWAQLPADYQSRTAGDKCQILLSNISTSPYAVLPTKPVGALSMLNMLMPCYLVRSFTHTADEMPESRIKLIHRYGAAAAVEFRVTAPGRYSGLFAQSTVGIARISTATPDVTQFTPGMGLKLLVSGEQSVNFQVMNSLDGQGTDTNPFRHSFTNAIPEPTRLNFMTRRLLKAFQATVRVLHRMGSVIQDERTLPLAPAAAIMPTGQAVAVGDVVAPYSITFEPDAALQVAMDNWIRANPTADFRVGLAQVVQPGARLYRVVVRATEGAPGEYIGELIATSAFVASAYQDERLFFSHLK